MLISPSDTLQENSVLPAFKEDNIPIVFSVDDTYAPYLAVAMYSLIKTSSPKHNYDICVLYKELSDENKERLRSLLLWHSNISLRFIDLSLYLAENLENKFAVVRPHISVASYYRVMIGDIFAAYDKVVYLDCDVILKADIAELYAMDIADYWIGAVVDIRESIAVTMNPVRSKKTGPWRTYITEKLGLKDPYKYFQSGVLLINIQKFIQEDVKNRCFAALDVIEEPYLQDQDIINAVAYQHIYFLPVAWNIEWQIPLEFENYKDLLSKDFYQQYTDALNAPCLIHYASPRKPWNYPEYPLSSHWWSVAEEIGMVEKFKAQLDDEAQTNVDKLIAALPPKPKISVIVPIYGVEKYLKQCVDSILSQTLNDIEIILVDDGSKDNCPQMIDEYARQDSRIVAVHKKNGGYGQSCNVGLAHATGEFIAIVEPDDWIAENMYEKLYSAAKKHNADVVKSKFYKYYDIENIKEENRTEEIQWFSEKNMPHGTFKISKHPEFFYFHPSIWSAIYRADLIKDNSISIEEIPGAGWTDNLFQIKTLCAAKSIFYTDKPYYYYRNKNLDDALDLKDQTIPYKRTETIHQWLQQDGIIDKKIWANLYKREIAYLYIVIRGVKWRNFGKIVPLILEWQQGLNPDYFDETILRPKEISLLKRLNSKKAIWQYFFHFHMQRIRRWLFSLSIKKTHFLLQFLGIQLTVGKAPVRPAFIKIHIGKKVMDQI